MVAESRIYRVHILIFLMLLNAAEYPVHPSEKGCCPLVDNARELSYAGEVLIVLDGQMPET